jgi:hypothetical protein
LPLPIGEEAAAGADYHNRTRCRGNAQIVFDDWCSIMAKISP